MSKKRNKTIIEFGSLSDQGMKRPDNQDSCGIFPQNDPNLSNPKGLLFIMADGMGGHVNGKEASSLAVKSVQKVYFSDQSNDIQQSLRNAVAKANSIIYNHSNNVDQFHRMGTTCSILALTQKDVYIAHVGDSRIYRINRHKIEQLTQDHTHVAEMQRHGILTEKEAKDNPQRSLLTRALGAEKSVEIDILPAHPVQAGDNYLLCTDGLASVSEQEITEIVLKNSPQRACKELINLENERGGNDNITIQVLKIKSTGKKAFLTIPKFLKDSLNKWLKHIAALMAVVILTACIFIFRRQISETFYGLLNNKKSQTTFNQKTRSTLEVREVEAEPNLSAQLKNAKSFLRAEKLDSALIIYKAIIEKNPLDLDAIDGLNQVADEYKKKADIFLMQGRNQNAISYYQKAADLHPQDQELKRLISLSKKRVQVVAPISISAQNEIIPDADSEKTILTATVPGDSFQLSAKEFVSRFDSSKWDFPSLSDIDYEIDATGITFSNSPRIKKAIYHENLTDINVEIQVDNFNAIGSGRFGIIIGYETTGRLNTENFFLISLSQNGHLVLNKHFQYKRQRLFSENIQWDSFRMADMLNLKVKCLGPWIMPYINEKLLKPWQGDELITGQVGLYADPDLQIKFSQFKISPAITTDIPNK